MPFHSLDLRGYLNILNHPDSWFALPLLSAADDAFFDACHKHLLSPANSIRLHRIRSLRRFLEALENSGYIRCIKLKLHPFQKGQAYMLDRGELHIMADLMFRSTHASFVTVVLHETAHIRLSCANDYPDLLQLDLQFAENFLKDQHDTLLTTVTPVEFFAQILSMGWLTELIRRFPDNRIRSVLESETKTARDKLYRAVDLLRTSSTVTSYLLTDKGEET